jgi:hypothetical protein
MKKVIQLIVIGVLLAIYAAAAIAVLHPHVSTAYRAFYITHTSTYNPAH